MIIFILVALAYLLFCLLYLENQYNHKHTLLIISASSKTSKNRLDTNKKLKNINKQIKLFLFWPILSIMDIINEIKRNKS